ncbi:MAG TPA: NAD(P)-dependent oxidoreductase [Vitreimonas sp.]|nr:NAD(P)-dependent oxidoreductase [Vitreimonas sp.]
MKKIGIVGMGIMGRGMADNFLKHGYQVLVWNRTEATVQEFQKKGAVICSSPAQVAEKADIVFEVTANDESSKAVWLGSQGILSGAQPRTILIASATLSVEWIDELINKCQKQGLSFLDIALTGGRVAAEAGTLTLLCGGQEVVLKEIESTLGAIAKKVIHFGPEGHGMRYKLILNFLQALHIVGFGQAMKLAKAYDMDLLKVSEALADRPGGIITQITQKTYFQEPDPITFSIEWITKDLTYVKQLAKDLDIKFLDEVLAEYKKVLQKGHAKKDWMSVNTL